MTIDATVGGANSNSYVTRSEALAYLGDRLGAETFVEEVNEAKLDRALITASRQLDFRVVWIGFKATDTQALEWPRIDEYDEPIVAANTIPTPIKVATYEYAFYLYTNGDPLNAATLNRVQVSSLEIEFKESGVEKTMLPDDVATILADYGQRRSHKPTIREVPLTR